MLLGQGRHLSWGQGNPAFPFILIFTTERNDVAHRRISLSLTPIFGKPGQPVSRITFGVLKFGGICCIL
jgi:hypothetical protein